MAREALAAGLEPVVVVLGHAAEGVRQALGDLPVIPVLNPEFAKGQSTSVRRGLATVPPEAVGAIFLPVDQPCLDAPVLRGLVERFLATGGPIVVPSHQGRRGAPVLLARELFSELAEVVGDEGGRQVIRRHPEEVVEVALDSPWPLKDIDTPEDLEGLLAGLGEKAE
jgi:CTP:molybdopterin cytidylyltransferase MocA